MRARLPGDLYAAEHACQLVDTFLCIQYAYTGARGVFSGEFRDLQLPVCKCGNLGQVGDAQYLPVGTECAQLLADNFRDPATDATVDFIEDQGRDGCTTAA